MGPKRAKAPRAVELRRCQSFLGLTPRRSDVVEEMGRSGLERESTIRCDSDSPRPRGGAVVTRLRHSQYKKTTEGIGEHSNGGTAGFPWLRDTFLFLVAGLGQRDCTLSGHDRRGAPRFQVPPERHRHAAKKASEDLHTHHHLHPHSAQQGLPPYPTAETQTSKM